MSFSKGTYIFCKKTEASNESTREKKKYSRIWQKCNRERLKFGKRLRRYAMHVTHSPINDFAKAKTGTIRYDVIS